MWHAIPVSFKTNTAKKTQPTYQSYHHIEGVFQRFSFMHFYIYLTKKGSILNGIEDDNENKSNTMEKRKDNEKKCERARD